MTISLKHIDFKKKRIFLDTMVWFNIIQRNSPKYDELLRILFELIHKQKIIVIVSMPLLFEITTPSDTRKSREIFRLFDALNEVFFFKNHDIIFHKELELQLISTLDPLFAEKYSIEFYFETLEERIIGSYKNHTRFEYIKARLRKHCKFNSKLLFAVLLMEKGKPKNEFQKNLDEIYAKDYPIKKFAEILADEENIMLADLYNSKKIHVICYNVYKQYNQKNNLSLDNFIKIVLPKLRCLITNCPSFGIITNLWACVRSNQDAYKSIKPNDFFDIEYLAHAIPYCDYIVCDRKYLQYAKNEFHYDQKFNTKIYSPKNDDLDHLIADLRALSDEN